MAFHNSPFNATIVNKRIEGTGTFTFKNGSIYKGSFKDGMFHGKGTIFFVNGGKLDADWTLGQASKEIFTFDDGLVYTKEGWDYCTKTDRRFYQERINGFLPGEPKLTNLTDSPVVPIVTDDHGYCYYDAAETKLYSFDGEVLRQPTIDEKKWLELQIYQSRDKGKLAI
ncbi:hypothetical protein BC833DRAFT_31960 [Globomyces pollinis-pini]|nr:hypothetical protein BC833DRAFT_31960 [Globomyces pollinis-pini]